MVKLSAIFLFIYFLHYQVSNLILLRDDARVLISFYFLMILTLSFLLISSRRLSVFSPFFLFSFLFYSYVPFLEYVNDVVYVSEIQFSDDDYFRSNMLILLVVVVVKVFEFFFNRVRKESYQVEPVGITFKYREILLVFLLSLLCFYLTLYVNNFDLNGLFFRSVTHGSRFSPVYQVLSNFSRFTLLLLFLSVYFSSCNKAFKFYLFILIVLCCFPTAMPRYFVALIYIPIMWSLFPFFRKGQNLIIAILIALLTVFPLLDKARRINDLNDYRFSYSFDFFLAGHFDSYQTLMRVLQQDIITGGTQLLGNLLFFIPRAHWPEKPFGSGYFMADMLNYNFLNTSMNYLAEGYINFGYFGVGVFVVVLLAFMRKVDGLLVRDGERINKFIFIFIFSFFIMIMRGDLLTVFSVLFSFAFSVFSCKVLLNRIMK